MLDNFRHLHFIGIGGSGISALAYLALAHGIKVAGSDMSNNPNTDKLEKAGAKIYIGHAKENLDELAELVIFSEAINRKENPEFLSAQKRGVKMMSYFEALGAMSAQKKTIVVTGTHGKTTTTAMLGQALLEAGEDPTVIVGSRVPAFENRNIHIGHSQWLVVEGCEYRRSFLSFKPFGVVILNCELEHVDYYKDEEDYVAAFGELVSKIPEDGFLIYNAEDANCIKVSQFCKGEIIGVTMSDAKSITLKIPGEFNKLNAAHALKAAGQISQESGKISQDSAKLLQGLANFSGTARRMEIKGEKNGIKVIDDYGHHPTEVRATLGALKEAYPKKRLICVFQPHQYSRTHQLIGDFAKAFGDADLVIIPNIFEARDSAEDKEKVSAASLAERIPGARHGENFEKTLEMLEKEAKKGDIVLTMGAGDVYKIGETFLT